MSCQFIRLDTVVKVFFAWSLGRKLLALGVPHIVASRIEVLFAHMSATNGDMREWVLSGKQKHTQNITHMFRHILRPQMPMISQTVAPSHSSLYKMAPPTIIRQPTFEA